MPPAAPSSPAPLLIDVGGSTTRLRCGGLHVREEGPGGPGVPFAESSMVRALHRVRERVHGEAPVVCGAAGAGQREGRDELLLRLRSLGHHGAVTVVPDGYGPLFALPGARGVVLMAGTGSLALARHEGAVERALGFGPTIGDPGSAVMLGRLAAAHLAESLDRAGPPGKVAERIAASACELAGVDDPRGALVALAAHPWRIGRLAPVAIALAKRSSPLREPVLASLAALAAGALAAARRAGFPEGERLEVHGFGGLFGEPGGWFRKQVDRLLRDRGARLVEVLPEEAALDGLAVLYRQGFEDARTLRAPEVDAISPTELDHPGSRDFDRMDAAGIVERMVEDATRVPAAAGLLCRELAAAVEDAARSLGEGGRLIYVGAGTSGRLGVLDASESPPTFHVPRTRVQGILAGGKEATFRSIEGAEDDLSEGRRVLRARRVGPEDMVVGVAASGSTPFVLGALAAARRAGCRTALVTANPAVCGRAEVDHLLALPTGPEVLRGSTRLKAGSAAKLVLNILSTGAWVLLGKCYGNYMVDLQLRCAKLIGRAHRIMRDLLPGMDDAARERLLASARGRVKTAVLMGRTGWSRADAERALAGADGRLGVALDAHEEER